MALDWMRTSYGGTGLDGPRVVFWIAASQASALVGLAWLAAARPLLSRATLPMVVVMPIFWIGFEAARWTVLGLVSQSWFPGVQLGTLAAEWLIIAQASDLGGSGLLTGIVASIGGIAADLAFDRFKRRCDSRYARRSIAYVAAYAAFLVTVLGYGAWRLSQTSDPNGPRIALISDDQSRVLRDSIVDATKSDGAALLPKPGETDAWLWSECAWESIVLPRGTADSRDDELAILERLAFERGVTLLVGAVTRTATGDAVSQANSLVVVDPKHGFQRAYDKAFLVPWREFTPHARWFGPEEDDSVAGTSHPTIEVKSGPRHSTAGAAICYDVAFPQVFLRAMTQPEPAPRPEFFAVASAERMDKTGRVQREMFRHTRLRAIEVRRAVVRNCDGGVSGCIDGCGRFTPSITGPNEVRVCRVPIDARRSVYVSGGRVTPMIFVVGVAIAAWVSCRRPGA